IDLGAGVDTLNIGSTNGMFTLLNVEQLNGSAGDDFYTLNNTVTGLAVDLGAGSNDGLTLANGANSLALTNVENVQTNDFSGPAIDDTLTLTNNVSGVSVNLQQGDNTLNLAAGVNTLTGLFNVNHVNGSAFADTLTISGGVFPGPLGDTIDLGGGTD